MISLERYKPVQQLRAEPEFRTVRAEAPDGVGPVVVKVLNPPWLSRPADRRAAWEAIRSWTGLHHDAFVRPLQVGWSPDGLVLVSPFLAAGSLEDRKRQGALASLDLSQFGTEICDALMCAHGHGVVHANLKPSNLVFDEEGHVHITDFRLGPMTNAGAPEGVPLEGLEYAAPEVAAGAPAIPASDQYSLGLILLTVLSRRSPRQSLGWLLTAAGPHAASGSSRPTSEDVSLPERVVSTLRRALRSRPEERFPSIDAFHRHFQYAMGYSTEPGPSEAAPPIETQPGPSRRRPSRMAVLASAVVLAVFLAVTAPMLSSASMAGDLFRGSLWDNWGGEAGESALADLSAPASAQTGGNQQPGDGDPEGLAVGTESSDSEGEWGTDDSAGSDGTEERQVTGSSSQVSSTEPTASRSTMSATATPSDPPTAVPSATPTSDSPSAPVPNASSCKADPDHPRYCTPTPGP